MQARAAISTTAVNNEKILYTITDEAPALATYALLPIIKRFTDPAGVAVESADISVASRYVADRYVTRIQLAPHAHGVLARPGALTLLRARSAPFVARQLC